MNITLRRLRRFSALIAIALAGSAAAQALPGRLSADQPDNGNSEDILAGRKGNVWRVPTSDSQTVRIPRVCASLRSAHFEGLPNRLVVVHPEVDFWELRYRGKPAASHIVLNFDAPPVTLDEARAIKQKGDGTLTLECSHGRPSGDKLRFEPQPHKNTIGYWAIATDFVTWQVSVTKPATFNVGLLQGASPKGGGTARISVLSGEDVVDSFEHQVNVTGHFQNFEWAHGGELKIEEPGEYSIRIEAVEIPNVALMDVRQVHLSPRR